jgi:hypothetical protein
MLRFAATGQSGNYQEIATVTGIPMGKSSGKVPAILDYCRGMGLVRLTGKGRSAVKHPELTRFGRIVFLEDPHLKERITQWIVHLNLCGSLTGADVWFQTFFTGKQTLGMRFPRAALEEHLALVYGCQRRGIIGPLIRMYEDEAAFSACGVLSGVGDMVVQIPAPTTEEFGFAYGAWILQLVAEHFPGVNQVTLTDLDQKGGWRSIPGWDITDSQRVMELLAQKGIVAVDRHMEPWILRPRAEIDDIWGRLYDDLI